MPSSNKNALWANAIFPPVFLFEERGRNTCVQPYDSLFFSKIMDHQHSCLQTIKKAVLFSDSLSFDVGHYLLTTSLPLYVPHALQTRCANFHSPQFGHCTMPGTCSLKCVRRSRFLVFDVLLKGTAIIPTSLSGALSISMPVDQSAPRPPSAGTQGGCRTVRNICAIGRQRRLTIIRLVFPRKTWPALQGEDLLSFPALASLSPILLPTERPILRHVAALRRQPVLQR